MMGTWTAGEIIETVLFAAVSISGLIYSYRTGEVSRRGAMVFGGIVLYSIAALAIWHMNHDGLFIEYAVMHL